MIKQYYRVFVSSPYLELKEARAKVIDALLRAGHFPMVMEYQAGAPVNQKANLEARLQGCDVVLVILGASYGSRIDRQNPSSISYTEFEFNTAQEIGIPIIPLTLDSCVGPAILARAACRFQRPRLCRKTRFPRSGRGEKRRFPPMIQDFVRSPQDGRDFSDRA